MVFLAQLLPGASEEDIDRLEQNIGKLSSVTQLLTGWCVGGGYLPDGAGRIFAADSGDGAD